MRCGDDRNRSVGFVSAYRPVFVVENGKISAEDKTVGIGSGNVVYKNVVRFENGRIVVNRQTFDVYVVKHRPAFGFGFAHAEGKSDVYRVVGIEIGGEINFISRPNAVVYDGDGNFFVFKTGNRKIGVAGRDVRFGFYRKLIIRTGRKRNIRGRKGGVRRIAFGVEYKEVLIVVVVHQKSGVFKAVFVVSGFSVVHAGEYFRVIVARFGPV